jgi:hypothetical protein
VSDVTLGDFWDRFDNVKGLANKKDGLSYLLGIIDKYDIPNVGITYLGYEDILRHDIVREFVIAFDKEQIEEKRKATINANYNYVMITNKNYTQFNKLIKESYMSLSFLSFNNSLNFKFQKICEIFLSNEFNQAA